MWTQRLGGQIHAVLEEFGSNLASATKLKTLKYSGHFPTNRRNSPIKSLVSQIQENYKNDRFFFQKEQMQRHICSLQISRMCGSHALSADHLTALYTAFTLHYEHGLNAFGIDMLPTDLGLSDAYALLAGELGHFRHSNLSFAKNV